VSISKSVRFEIFARDAFTCQYCGRRPPDVVLELDHIHPRSKGGTDDLINLVTSCWDCNRGKSAKIISEVAPRPDADLAFLKIQQEIAEAERFLLAKEKLDAAQDRVCDALQDSWSEKLTEKDLPSKRVLLPWIKNYGAEEVEASILCAVPAYMRNQFGSYNEFGKLIKYVGAILRNRAERREQGVEL
jgi:hypothetical protein